MSFAISCFNMILQNSHSRDSVSYSTKYCTMLIDNNRILQMMLNGHTSSIKTISAVTTENIRIMLDDQQLRRLWLTLISIKRMTTKASIKNLKSQYVTIHTHVLQKVLNNWHKVTFVRDWALLKIMNLICRPVILFKTKRRRLTKNATRVL